MESLDRFILDLTLILLAASISAVILKKMKQPVVLGYIIAGFLISPNFKWLPTVVDSADISVWADIGMIFLMFSLGLEFNFKKIADVGKSAIITAGTVITAMVLLGYCVGQLMGWSTMTSIFLGGMLSMSSTMIILKAYEDMGIRNTPFAENVIGTLIIEDIAGIFMMIVLSTIAVGQGNTSALSLAGDLGILVLYLLVWFVLGIYLIPTFIRKASSVINDEILLLISVAICFVMVVVANMIGFSSALGAFMGGSIISCTLYGERAEQLVKPVKDIFGAVFFVSVGMMVVPSMLIEYIVPIVILTLVTVFGQMTFATVGMLLSGQSLYDSVRGGFSMVQIGEFSFILASLGKELGVIDDFLYPVIVCISIITTFTTPVFIRKSEKVYQMIEDRMPEKVRNFREKYADSKVRNQDGDSSDSDWKIYLKRFFIHMAACAVMIAVVYIVGEQLAEPLFSRIFEQPAAGIITLTAVYAGMLPFIAIMCTRKNLMHMKLWTASPANRLPLVTLNAFKYIYCAVFLTAACRNFAGVPHWVTALAAAAVIIMIVKSDFIYGSTMKMEMKFITNMNEKTLQKARRERALDSNHAWLDKQLNVCRVTVAEAADAQKLYRLNKRIYGNVKIIKVVRAAKCFNLPEADFTLNNGDRIDIIGTSEQLDAYIASMNSMGAITETEHKAVTLHEYTHDSEMNGIDDDDKIVCCPIEVDRNSEFNRKTIKSSGFRKKYGGFIVGIERDALPVCNPDPRMPMKEGDLIWALGNKKMADTLLVAGYMENGRNL